MNKVWMAGLAVASVLALSACGGSGSGTTTGTQPTQAPAATTTSDAPAAKTPSAEEILTKVQESLRTATSLELKVSGVQAGQNLEVELVGNREGTNQRLKLKLGDGKGEAEVVTVDGEDYVKADDEFWAANGIPASAAERLRGKYVASGGTQFSSQYNLGKLLDEAETGSLSLQDKLNTKVEEDILDGLPAYKLSSRVGNDDTVMWTETDGDYHLRKVTGTLQDGGTMEMTLDDWNKVEPIAAPPADEVIRR